MSNDFGMYPVSASPSLDPATVRAFVNPMMGATATAPGPSFGADTSTQQPDIMQMVMDSLTQGGQKIDDLYTTYQDLLKTQSGLLEKAGGGPSETQEQADVLKKRKEALDIEIGKMKSAHVPDAPVFDTPNYPALNLPSAPVAQQAKPNPIAQLMAAVAGFVRPSAANQFNAAALQGSILHANQQNQQAEKQFQDNVQIIQAHHADEIQRENARIKVEQANKEGKYTHDVANFHKQMEEADAERKSAELGGEASVLGKFAEDKKPSDEAKAKLGLLAPQVTSTEKLMASMLQRQEQLLGHAATLQYQKEYHDEQAKQTKQKEEDLKQYHADTLKERKYAVDTSNQARRDIETGREHTSRDIAEMRRSAGSRVGKGGMIHIHNDPGVTIAEKDLNRADADVRRAERLLDSNSVNDTAGDPDKTQRKADLDRANEALSAAKTKYTDEFNRAFQYELSQKPGGSRPAGIPDTFKETSPGVWQPPPGVHVRKYNPATGKAE